RRPACRSPAPYPIRQHGLPAGRQVQAGRGVLTVAKRWIENVLVRSLGLRPGERVVVMADRRLQPAARELAAAAREFGAARVLHVTLPEPGRPLALVSGAFVRAVRQADVVITMRSGLSLLDEDPHIR